MMKQRAPAVANAVVEGLPQEADAIGCTGELTESAARLDHERRVLVETSLARLF